MSAVPTHLLVVAGVMLVLLVGAVAAGLLSPDVVVQLRVAAAVVVHELHANGIKTSVSIRLLLGAIHQRDKGPGETLSMRWQEVFNSRPQLTIFKLNMLRTVLEMKMTERARNGMARLSTPQC